MSGTGRASGRRFDRDHGVTTQALFLLSQLGSTRGEAYSHATHYEPVPVEAFEALVALVPPAFVAASTFVDAGSGMGRAVLLASRRPFKQVVGIELSPALHAIASANLAGARDLERGCRDVRLLRGDARRATYPKGDLVVFLFNPFDEIVLRATLERILASRSEGDEVLLLYHVPVHRDVVSEFAGEIVADTADGLVARLTRSRGRPDPSASRC